MSENTTETEPETIIEIETIYEGQCESISGRSTLTYAVGRNPEDGSLALRLVRNSKKGMFSKEPASASEIDAVVIGEEALTGTAFQVLHPGRSINTGGFVMAVCKDLGLIRVNAENSRLHENIPTVNFEQAVMARIGQAGEAAPKTGGKTGGKAVGAATKRKQKEG